MGLSSTFLVKIQHGYSCVEVSLKMEVGQGRKEGREIQRLIT